MVEELTHCPALQQGERDMGARDGPRTRDIRTPWFAGWRGLRRGAAGPAWAVGFAEAHARFGQGQGIEVSSDGLGAPLGHGGPRDDPEDEFSEK